MKDYLVLLYGPGIHPESMEASEKMEHYKLWGTYLQPFSDDEKYLSGSPTRPIQLITAKGKIEKRTVPKEQKLEGFMMIRAGGLDELYETVMENPILAVDGAYLEVHELDPQALISSKLPEV